jgi:uncharacterized repeat protein (TIGR01451 family)
MHVPKRPVALVCLVMLAALLALGQGLPTVHAKPAEPQGTVNPTQPPPPTTAVPTTPAPVTEVPTTPAQPTDMPTAEPTQPAATDVPTRAPENHTGNVAVTKRADPTEARIGDTVTFSIQVTNPSRYDTPRVVLTDELPGYFEVLSARATRGAPVVSGNTLTVDLDTVVSGEEILVTVQVRVLAGAPELMVNIAQLTSPNGSDSAEDNISRATVRRIDDSASAPRREETGTATALPGAGGTPTATPADGGTGAQPTRRPTATPRPPRRLPVTGEDSDPISLVLLLIGAGLAVTAGSLLLRRKA